MTPPRVKAPCGCNLAVLYGDAARTIREHVCADWGDTDDDWHGRSIDNHGPRNQDEYLDDPTRGQAKRLNRERG